MGESDSFVERFGMSKTSDYYMSAYDKDAEHFMACAWVHEMCYLFDACVPCSMHGVQQGSPMR